MSDSEVRAKSDWWKHVATLLASVLFAGAVGWGAALFSTPDPMTREEIREEVRKAVAESFTEVSMTKGMYAIEGRPKMSELDARMKTLEDRYYQMLEIQARIEVKLDLILKDRAQD